MKIFSTVGDFQCIGVIMNAVGYIKIPGISRHCIGRCSVQPRNIMVHGGDPTIHGVSYYEYMEGGGGGGREVLSTLRG